jgi:hypothetical protein
VSARPISRDESFLRRLTFVIHIQRTTAPGHGAVVDYGALFAGHSFPDQAGEGRRLLAIKVRFEPMAYCLVEQDARPSRTEHHFHVPCRSFAGVELQNGLARGFSGKELGSLVAKEEVERDTSAAAGGSTSRRLAARTGVGLGDTGNIHAGQRLRVFGKGAVGADDEYVPQFVGVVRAHFLDAGIVCASGLIGAHQQFNFSGDVGIHRGQGYRVQTAGRFLLESRDRRFGRCARDQGSGAGRMQNPLRREIVGVGVAGALA